MYGDTVKSQIYNYLIAVISFSIYKFWVLKRNQEVVNISMSHLVKSELDERIYAFLYIV